MEREYKNGKIEKNETERWKRTREYVVNRRQDQM